ncbi:ATP-binding protein [Roseibium alexandrii]|uniref:ATP-binding protein n=1 Tax=Roseibium alexandrii TaxID=388408 RepID=UPI003752D0E8
MDKPRVIGHVVSVHGFRIKVELSSESNSSSRATLDGVQRAVAINAFLTFDLGAGAYAIGNLTDLEAIESYDPNYGTELSLELMKPRRIASVQLLGTVKQAGRDKWKFDPGITILPTLETSAEIANPKLLASVFSEPPKKNEPKDWLSFIYDDYDFPLEIGYQSRDENTKVKVSFNDLFSRPLAIVGNTGSGKSYTVASLLLSILENDLLSQYSEVCPHIFVLDINGEYANALLPDEINKYERKPNEAYVNGERFSLPLWLMNSEEICEWLTAAEQTQQPVLKAWWAKLKGDSSRANSSRDFYLEALNSIQQMYPLNNLKKNDARNRFLAIRDFLSGSGINTDKLGNALAEYFKKRNGEYINFYGEVVTNGTEIENELLTLRSEVEDAITTATPSNLFVGSADAPIYFSKAAIANTATLASAASEEDASQIEQHLTTLRMRIKARLSDRRWSVLTNYDEEKITDFEKWYQILGFGKKKSRITVIDLSMLSHEVLPFICSIFGRILLETREKLPAKQRYCNPWLTVLEEAHNYARPARQGEDRGQALSRKAFERVAKEGRKFGMSLIVASQRPSEISPTIVSQCANFFSHRLQNPDDIEHFKRIIPKQAQRLLDQVTVLSSGEAIVFGSAVHIPARVQITKPSKEPWSSTAAPFYEWISNTSFPMNEVFKAWGIATTENNLPSKADTDDSSNKNGTVM